MRRRPSWYLALIVIAFCLVIVDTASLRAWGRSGHRIVALVAVDLLTPAARTEVRSLMGPEDTLMTVAVEADDIRDSRPETKNWRFVDIHTRFTAYDEARDCPATEFGDCIVNAIRRFTTTLADHTQPNELRREALVFLVHLIGDLHQPLHCADRDDRGGNALKVKFFGARSNLHAVWDSGLIEQADLTEREFADQLLAGVTPPAVAAMQAGSVIDWVLEAHTLASSHAYRVHRSRLLGPQYYEANADTVDTQLTRGGVRLAKVLNDAL